MRRTLRVIDEIDQEFPSLNDSSAIRHKRALRKKVGLAADSPIASDTSADDMGAFDEGVQSVMASSAAVKSTAVPVSSVAANRVLMADTIQNHSNRMEKRM